MGDHACKAKALFGQKRYAEAESAFLLASKSAKTPPERAVGLSNAAQSAINCCKKESGAAARAVAHARGALDLDASNGKAHFRLAVALAASRSRAADCWSPVDVARHACDIAMSYACAVALRGHNSVPRIDLSGFVASASPRCNTDVHRVTSLAFELLRYAEEHGATLIVNSMQLASCRGVAVVTKAAPIHVNPAHTVRHVVGLDGSAKLSGSLTCPHTLFVIEHEKWSVWRLRLVGAAQAMACTVGDLSLVDCVVQRHHEHGVLVAGTAASALIAFSSILECPTGIEVREGGRIYIVRSKIENIARHAVSCYGGARAADLEEVVISNIGIEGVQCIGPRSPADLRLPGMPRQHGSGNLQESIARAAQCAARRDVTAARLEVRLKDCTLRNCGTDLAPWVRSGVTVDEGAVVRMRGCLLERCSMSAVYVKGGSDVTMEYCRVNHGISGNSGLRVDVNYDGDVLVRRCAMVGKLKLAVVDVVKDAGAMGAQMRAFTGVRSASATKVENKFMIRERQAPSITSLRSEAAAEAAAEVVKKDATASESKMDAERLCGDKEVSPVNPVEDILSWAGLSYRTLSKQHVASDYPIGNTYGRNVLADKTSSTGEVSILLAACGDIRNVVETIVAQAQPGRMISFLLNDCSPAIIARDLVLLELAARLWPSGSGEQNNDDIASATWLHAWGSIALRRADREAIDGVLADFASGSFPEWLQEPSTRTAEQLKYCFRAWKACERSLDDVRAERSAITLPGNDERWAALAASAAGLRADVKYPALLRNAELLGGRGNAVNPTLLAGSPSLCYTMYESSIFRALDLRNLVGGNRDKLYSGARRAIGMKGSAVARSLLSGTTRIVAMPGDICQVLSNVGSDFPDVIDLSNAMDYVTMPACLIATARCLQKPGAVSVLNTMMAVGTSDEVECIAMRGGNLNVLCDSLGIEVSCQHHEGRNMAWSVRALERREETDLFDEVMKTVVAWCQGPAQWNPPMMNQVVNILAAWPSSVLALQLAHAALGDSRIGEKEGVWTSLVGKMCDYSHAVRKFAVQMRAYAAVSDGNSHVLCVTISMEDTGSIFGMGMSTYLIMEVGEHCFDSINWEPSRGVCELLVCAADIKQLQYKHARLRIQGFRPMFNREQLSTVSTANVAALETRELTNEEKNALRCILVPTVTQR